MPKYSNDVCKLVIKNMELIEELPNIFEYIEAIVFEQLKYEVKQKVNKRNFEVYEEDDYNIIFLDPRWLMNSDGKPYCHYNIYPDGDCEYHLGDLTNSKKGALYCIYLYVDYKLLSMSKKATQKILNEFLAEHEELARDGLKVDEGTISLQFSISKEEIAASFPAEFPTKALGETIDKFLNFHEIFCELQSRIAAEAGVSTHLQKAFA